MQVEMIQPLRPVVERVFFTNIAQTHLNTPDDALFVKYEARS
jgi:hypothetical protein